MSVRGNGMWLKAKAPWIGLLVATVVTFAIRVAISSNRSGPLVIADEIGYLLNARVMVGGAPGMLVDANTYAGGYSFVLTPMFALFSSPASIYRAVMVTNAALGAAVLPLLFALMRRAFRLRPWPALAAAATGAVYPAAVLYSEVALAENLLIPLLCVWLLTVTLAVQRGSSRTARWWWVVISSLTPGWLFWTHGRMVPVIGVHVVILTACALSRHIKVAMAIVGVVTTVVSSAAAYLFNAYLYSVSWPDKTLDRQSPTFGNLTDHVRLLHFGQFVNGELAYLCAATFGIAAVGLFALVACLLGHHLDRSWIDRWRHVRSPGDGDGVSDDRMLIVISFALVATLAGVLLVTGLISGELNRPDYLVYGRYVEVLAPPLIAVGVAACVQWWPAMLSRTLLVTGGIALTSTAVLATVWQAGDTLVARNIGWVNVLGLRPLGGGLFVNPQRAAFFGLAVLVGFAGLAAFRWTLPIGVAAVLVISLISARSLDHDFFDGEETRFYPTDDIAVELAMISPSDDVAYDTSSFTEAEFRFQFYLDDTTIELFNSHIGELPPAAADVVIAPPGWPQAGLLGAVQIWHDPVSNEAVWRLPAR